MSKEMWIDEFDRLYQAKLERGLSDMQATEEAGQEADAADRDRLADMIDHARLLFKETKP